MTESAQDPAQIGPFVVLRKLGEGAMGVVYAGFDVQLDRKVAIKLVHRHLLDRPEVRLRMTREAQAMARLSSPHVVHVYQVGEHDDGIYMAMEYIDGLTLGAWLRARPRPWQLVLRTVCDAGRGLAAAHHAGLTHRDFKPDNVLVDADGRARVLDFGLAQTDAAGQHEQAMAQPETVPTEEEEVHALGDDIHWSVRLTERGKALGTPAYMSPEQHFGGPVGPVSDQFSFSITLYEALYGYRPFYGDTWNAIKQQVIRGVVPPPPVETRVPKRVYRALVRGLAIAPDARWPSLDAMLDALEHDPWRVRMRVAGVAGLIGVASAASYAVAVTQISPVTSCDATAELAGVWDHERRTAVSRAFTATRAPFAAEVQERTLARLDAYAASWTAEHTAACEANAAGRQTNHVMDLRSACLGRRKSQVAALVDIFTEADRAVVERAVQAVAALPSVKACADVDGLLTAVPPPSDPTTAARVEDLRERLARATSLEATGQYEQGLQLAAQVRAEARILGYAPLDAEAALVEGKLLMVATKAETADAALAHALRVAITHDLKLVAAEAAAVRLFVISDGLGRPAEALVTRPIAEALVERASGDGQLSALLSNNLGAAYERAGDVPAARGHYERSLELLQRASAGDPLSAVIHHNLGGMYLDEGQLGQARVH
ncbi:MAG TPA: serine/threonine-protein kinase, partial [Nannocystis sp.]